MIRPLGLWHQMPLACMIEENEMEKTTFIFDLDGLLADSEIIAYRCYEELLKDYGQTITLEEYINGFSGNTLVGNCKLILKMHPELPYDLDSLVPHIHALEKYIMERDGVPLKPGAKELLAALKAQNRKIVLATSSLRDRAEKLLRENDVFKYFDDQVYGSELEHGKPAPDIFQLAAAKVHSEPEECVVLEDSVLGIEAAVAAGIDVICIPDMKKPPQQYIDKTLAVLPSLENLLPYINK